jgi:drug/metabolite transporter (DMT)-like permease
MSLSRRGWWLFLTPVAIWSTTFHAILYQLDSPTTPAWAVALRFALAAGGLALWCRLKGIPLAIPPARHPLILLSGVLAYSVSYVLTYLAEQDVPSGLVAICFTLMVFFTPVLARVFPHERTPARVWVGGVLGVAGVALCFLPSLLASELRPNFGWGLAMMLIAAAASSGAAVGSLRLNRHGIAVTAYTTWAMAYGAVCTALWAMASGQALAFDPRPGFWLALAYLSIFGTVVAFLCYLSLLREAGAGVAMYVSVLSPLGAVGVSIVLEGLRPEVPTVLGILLALGGAWVTLRSPSARSPAVPTHAVDKLHTAPDATDRIAP